MIPFSRRGGAWRVSILIGVLECTLFLTAEGKVPAARAQYGRIFILGEEILPPWEFSGIGSDTLRLNGIPFRPVRSNYEPPQVTVPGYVAERSALWDSAFMRTRDIEERDERNRAIAQFYESSELVDSLVFSNPWDPSGFTIYWRGDGLGEFSPLWMAGGGREPSAPSDSMTVAAGHESAIELFWLAMNQGYLLVLVRPGWQFACLGDKTEITVDVISTIRKGDEPDSAQVVESCFRSWMTVNTFRKWMNPAPSK